MLTSILTKSVESVWALYSLLPCSLTFPRSFPFKGSFPKVWGRVSVGPCFSSTQMLSAKLTHHGLCLCCKCATSRILLDFCKCKFCFFLVSGRDLRFLKILFSVQLVSAQRLSAQWPHLIFLCYRQLSL